MCKTLIYNTETNLVASLYVDAPHVVVKSRQHDTSQYASLTTNTNPLRPPFRRRLKSAKRRFSSEHITRATLLGQSSCFAVILRAASRQLLRVWSSMLNSPRLGYKPRDVFNLAASSFRSLGYGRSGSHNP